MDSSLQTITEKHKLNVPETMTEVLDVSDEEGKVRPCARANSPHAQDQAAYVHDSTSTFKVPVTLFQYMYFCHCLG